MTRHFATLAQASALRVLSRSTQIANPTLTHFDFHNYTHPHQDDATPAASLDAFSPRIRRPSTPPCLCMSHNRFVCGQASARLSSRRRYLTSRRESFDSIYLDLSKQPGKCRFAETGLGWKPSGGGDAFTLDKSLLNQAIWSKAARGQEVKVVTREGTVYQLDGFKPEVGNTARTKNNATLTFIAGL